jgi:hypothetical protein
MAGSQAPRVLWWEVDHLLHIPTLGMCVDGTLTQTWKRFLGGSFPFSVKGAQGRSWGLWPCSSEAASQTGVRDGGPLQTRKVCLLGVHTCGGLLRDSSTFVTLVLWEF